MRSSVHFVRLGFAIAITTSRQGRQLEWLGLNECGLTHREGFRGFRGLGFEGKRLFDVPAGLLVWLIEEHPQLEFSQLGHSL